jgi:3'5'-cyclic nucleotide phosphodiesterase
VNTVVFLPLWEEIERIFFYLLTALHLLCSHVTMSTKNLLELIRKEEENLLCKSTRDVRSPTPTFGITSDPLTVFAVVFSSIMHDIGHPGVSNATLVSRKDLLAKRYNDKSPAESNSFDIAWNIFMEPSYDDLRACICSNESAELDRFRQLVINMTVATDLFDPALQSFRDGRGRAAFGANDGSLSSSHSSSHRKEDAIKKINLQKTVLLEYIVQASDIVHTMQHFTIFEKWNRKLFQEEYDAFRAGRVTQDPSEVWYENELHFYDTYVIPLIRKLQKSRVFLDATASCCDTLLEFALDNRQEWESKGRGIVGDMVQSCLQKRGENSKLADAFERAMKDSDNDSADEPLRRLPARGISTISV